MKQKIYGYLGVLLILSVDMSVVFPKVETFGFEHTAPTSTAAVPNVEAFGFAQAPQKQIEKDNIQAFNFKPSDDQKIKKENAKEEQSLFEQLVTIETALIPISNVIEALFKKYTQESQPPLQVFSFLKKGQGNPVHSLLGGTPVNILDKESFATFQQCLNGSNSSYLSLLNQVWLLYAHQSGVAGKQNAQAAQDVIVGAFSKGSVALLLYQQMAAHCITFLKLRLGAFSLSTFSQSGAQHFLNVELPVLDKIMSQVKTSFDTHFAGGADGFPAVKKMNGVDAQLLMSNYSSIYSSYVKQRTTLCAQFVLSLFQSLAAISQPSLALSQPITTICGCGFNTFDAVGVLDAVDKFSTLGQTALGALEKDFSFGIYKSPSQALQALNGWLASFYVYCAVVGQNVVSALAKSDSAMAYQNQMMGSQGTSQASSSFYASVFQLFNPVQNYYQKAAQYYAAQSDVQNATVYSQFGSYLASGLTYWKKAEASLMNSDFAGAVASYQLAANCFKNAGNFDLFSVLSHRTDTVTLSDYQMLLQSYMQYYQLNPSLNVLSFVTQMTTPLPEKSTLQEARSWHTDYPNGFVQLFYYDAAQNTTGLTPSFQGIAWLAGQATSVFSHMLNAYQTDNSASGLVIKKYLQQALVVLENMVQGAQGMFYNGALLAAIKSLKGTSTVITEEEMAANANLGSATVSGVVEGAFQYVKIYENFSAVDAVLSQPVTSASSMNGVLQLPFQGFFQGTPISGFAQFNLLTQIYWSLLNSSSCSDLVQKYPQYTQTIVSSALILAQQAEALCADPSLAGVFPDGYQAAIGQKITALLQNEYGGQKGVSLLIAEGDKFQKSAKTALDYESALSCYRVAGLAGNVDAQNKYFELLDSYAQWVIGTATLDYGALAAAGIYYCGYLAQQKGWKSPFDSTKKLQGQLQNFAQQFSQDLQSFAALVQAQSYDEAIKQLEKFVILQNEVKFMTVRQKREQLFFGFSENAVLDFIILNQGAAVASGPSLLSQVPTLVQSVSQTTLSFSFPSASTLKCPAMVDPLANLAQLYLAQGMVLLKGLKSEFAAGKYDTSVQETYDQIIDYFMRSIDFFGKSNHSEMIVKVQQALTEGTAFAYFSLVIPSDKIIQLLAQYTAPQPSFSGAFVTTQTKGKVAAALEKARNVQAFSFVEPKSPIVRKKEQLAVFSFVKRMSKTLQSSGLVPSKPVAQVSSSPESPFMAAVKKDQAGEKDSSPFTKHSAGATNPSFISDNEPEYLIRYSEDDLTVYAQQEKQLGTIVSGTSISSSGGVTYQTLLVQAKQLLGSQTMMQSSTSDTTLVTNLVVPLYRKFLMGNGYTSDFATLDQEVDRYSKQVMELVTQGMRCGTVRLFTSYTLQSKKMSDGSQHIVLITSNGPLQAVPRFQGEIKTALYYYMQYGKFYAFTPQAVQVGGTVFFQIPDPQFTHQAEAFKNVLGAYLGQMVGYEEIVENCMEQAPPANLTIEEKKNYSFESYASLYQTVANAYSWVLGALNGVQTVQQDQGIFWMSTESFNALNFAQYSNYMNNNARFLVGYPLTSSYKQIMNDIFALSTMAMSYGQGASDQALLSRMLGVLYENSAQLALLYNQQAPAVDGYPSTAKTNLPVGELKFTVKYPTCALPVKNSLQAPTSFVMPWGNYAESSKYYLKAYTSYQSAYNVMQVMPGNVFANDVDYRRAWGRYVASLVYAVAQRIALFGRNALKATVTKTASGSSFTLDTNDHFKTVLKQGQTYGGVAAQQGFAALGGGILESTNSAIIQNQYTLMKSLLLDAFIYCSSAQQLLENTVGNVTQKVADTSKTNVGKILKCAFAYYMPDFQAVRAQKNNGSDIEEPTLVVAWPDNEVGLDRLGTKNIQQLAYSSTFSSLINYSLSFLMGSEEDKTGPFNKLIDSGNLLALSGFVSQLYGMLMVLYSQSFLPVTDRNDPSKIGTDIQAAIQAQQQGMIMDSESYVG